MTSRGRAVRPMTASCPVDHRPIAPRVVRQGTIPVHIAQAADRVHEIAHPSRGGAAKPRDSPRRVSRVTEGVRIGCFWNGTSWIDESAEAKKPPPQPSKSAGRRRFRDWAATGVMGLALVGLIIPVFGIASASQVPTQLKPWVTDYATRRTRRTGRGSITRAPGHRPPSGICGRARSRRDEGRRSARITFDGTGIAWIGPVGPTRGKANVYVDGQLVKIVDTHATHYAPTKVLFKTTFAKLGQHTLTHRRERHGEPSDSRHRRVRRSGCRSFR